MPEHRRKFSPRFKAEAMQMVISTGKPGGGAVEPGLAPVQRRPGRGTDA